MISEAAVQLGPIDILINNAGLRKVSPISELSVEEWREVVVLATAVSARGYSLAIA